MVQKEGDGGMEFLRPVPRPWLELPRHQLRRRRLEVRQDAVLELAQEQLGHTFAARLRAMGTAANVLADDAEELRVAVPLRQEAAGALRPLHGQHALVAATATLKAVRPARPYGRLMKPYRPNAASVRVYVRLLLHRPRPDTVARLVVGNIRAIYNNAFRRLPRRTIPAVRDQAVAVAPRQATAAK